MIKGGKMRKIGMIILLVLCLCLSSCDGYHNKYKATMFVHNQDKNSCSASFSSFEGNYVFNCKRTLEGKGGISYTATLQEGTMSVYYDANNSKDLLFTIQGGESFSDTAGVIEEGKKVYLIIEASSICKNGEFTFNFD